MQRLPAITHDRFSLIRFRSPLLTESRLLSLPVGTEMFHFPTFPPPALYIQAGVTGLASSRVSPFGNPRITVWLSTPRGLSQIPTSFFGSWYQGIHRAPLKTWPQRCSRPLCSSQHTGGTPPHAAPTPTSPKRTEAVRPTGKAQLKAPEQNARAFRTQQRAKHHPPRSHLPQPPQRGKTSTSDRQRPTVPTNRCSTLEQPPRHQRSRQATWTPSNQPPATNDQEPKMPVLLRKEVIQPHLPVRLPCYDLVPIAEFILDALPPCGLRRRCRMPPTFVA